MLSSSTKRLMKMVTRLVGFDYKWPRAAGSSAHFFHLLTSTVQMTKYALSFMQDPLHPYTDPQSPATFLVSLQQLQDPTDHFEIIFKYTANLPTARIMSPRLKNLSTKLSYPLTPTQISSTPLVIAFPIVRQCIWTRTS